MSLRHPVPNLLRLRGASAGPGSGAAPSHRTRARWLTVALGLWLAAVPAVFAATADVSNVPLGTVSTQKAKPNLMFVLDDSGSMGWDYMPDNISPALFGTTPVGYWSPQCNGVAYNPALTYLPPVKADGSRYADAPFSNAPVDGYNAASASINLGSDNSTYSYAGTNHIYRAWYYTYVPLTGSPAAMDWTYRSDGTVNTGTTFYQECTTAYTSTTRFQRVLVSSLTSAQKQNFANWFAYYRTRILTMRSAAGQAFQGLGSDFRVGFTKISDSGVTGTSFLGVNDFEATQKSSFFSLLYAAAPGGTTPLRGALAKVGRYYGNRYSGPPDPVQYSCQRNYTLMSTDGYWNTGNETASYGPQRLDGSTPVDQQDGNEVRPLRDGSRSTYTVTTTQTTAGTKTVTTPLQWQRRAISVSGSLLFPGSGCSLLAPFRAADQPQRCNPDRTGSTVKRYSTSTVSSATTTYVDGTASGTTTSGPITTDTLTSTTTSAAPSCSSWANTGTATVSCRSLLSLNDLLASLGLGSSGGTTPAAWVVNGADGTTTTTGATATATTTSPTTTLDGDSNTLADIAQYYYITDLRPDKVDEVPIFGRDTARHQHMTTFTLGLGVKGTLAYDRNYLTQSSGDYVNLTNGSKNWPAPVESTAGGDARNIDDLWHAAVNGRGQYFSATDPTSLGDAISTTLNEITKASGSGAAAAASALTPVTGDDWLFLPSFTTIDWTGDVRAFRFGRDAAGNLVIPATTDANKVWSARERLDARPAASPRMIWFNGGGTLRSFTDTNLAAAGHSALFNVGCGSGATLRPSQCDTISAAAKAQMTAANLVAYLAGDTSLYLSSTNSAQQVFRSRTSRLGDTVNAGPVYVGAPPFNYGDAGYAAYRSSRAGRTKVIYVAANDGMLHAFKVANDSTGGSELWAYVPTAAMPDLWRLADRNYASNHRYYVDAAPNIGDVYDAGSGRWRTILVGGLGLGGRGYYALDVTDPENPALLWEIDTRTTGFESLGLTTGNPIITKNAAGTWTVVFSSGTNNVAGGDGVGRLYTVNAITGALMASVATSAGDSGTPSNLGRVNAWVKTDTDNTALRFYAGDMLGNLWRFDPDDRVPPSGAEALLLGRALTPTGEPQPITAKPVLTEATLGGVGVPIISFGTGRMLGLSDLTDTRRQSIYAVKDSLGASGLGVLRTTATSGLVQQTLNSSRQIGSPRSVDWSGQNGWFVDLDQPASGTPRERVHLDGVPLSAGVLAFASTEPIDDACSQGGVSYLYQFDLATGNVLAARRFDSIIVGVSRFVGKDNRVSGSVTLQNQEIKEEASGGSTLPSTFSIRRSGWRELTD